jgi:hypothetical protein
VDLAKVPECGLTARGTRIATKPVQKVTLAPEKTKPGRK